MKLYLFLVLLIVASSSVYAQSQMGQYSVSSRDFRFDDNFYTNAPVKMRVFYPKKSTQEQSIADGKFPVVAFGHGFVMNYLAYTNLFEHLASWGYIVATLDEQNGFNVNHFTFAQQLSASVRYLQSEGMRKGSFFFAKTDTACAIFGHSMGGGASMLTPLIFPKLTAIAGLAPAQTSSTPTAIDGLKDINTPVLIISARGDSVTPEQSNQVPMFNNAFGAKQRISILKGGHCNFTDTPNLLCGVGANSAGDKGTLSPAQQQLLTKRYLTAFFNYYLKGNRESLAFICGDSVRLDREVENFTNITCPTGRPTPVIQKQLNTYPNPSQGLFTVSGLESGLIYEVIDVNSTTIHRFQAEDFYHNIDLSNFPDGLYILKSWDLSRTPTQKMILLK